MQQALGANRRCTSVPSLGHLAGYSLQHNPEVLGHQDKGSQACFSPVFDLELDSKLGSSNHLDRCFSHQHLNDQSAAGTSLLQQMLTLCRCSSPVQAQLLQQLQRLRSAAYAASPTSPTSTGTGGLLSGGSGHSDDAAACVLTREGPCTNSFSAVLEEARLDVEGMACELLALGYMVQVRDGAQQQERGKTPRSCLQNLRHRYIVCLGVRNAADGEPSYLPEPLVVEPRLREQFTIAHPTPDYEALLQSVPPCFVGPVSNLEAVVKLMCEQMTVTFKLQGLPVPPWRTRTALLSKWSPAQLAELAAKIASLRRLAAAVPPVASRAIVPCQSHDRLYNGDRPAAAHADHAAVGSAPTTAVHSHAAIQAAMAAAGAVHAAYKEHQVPQCSPLAFNGTAQLQQQDPGLPVSSGMQPPVAMGGYGAPSMQAVGRAGPGGVSTIVEGVPSVPPPHNNMFPVAEQPFAADGAMAALIAHGGGGAPPGVAAFKFTRNASAEWKHQRSTSRNIKGLLAAALKKPLGGSSRSNLLATGAAGGSAAAELGPGQPVSSAGPHSNGMEDGQQHTVGSGSDALIRRTHFRAACDEPWRRITTVRLGGAYAQQQQQQQRPPQQPACAPPVQPR